MRWIFHSSGQSRGDVSERRVSRMADEATPLRVETGEGSAFPESTQYPLCLFAIILSVLTSHISLRKVSKM